MKLKVIRLINCYFVEAGISLKKVTSLVCGVCCQTTLVLSIFLPHHLSVSLSSADRQRGSHRLIYCPSYCLCPMGLEILENSSAVCPQFFLSLFIIIMHENYYRGI